MIKVKFFNMHWNRSNNYDQKSYEEDKGWMIGLSGQCTPNNSLSWKDIQITFDDDYDYAVIIDQIFKPSVDYINPEKSVLFRLEPKTLRDICLSGNNYLDESKYIKIYRFCALWGWSGFSYNQFFEEDFTKTKTLSSIISANQGIYGHINRLNFLPYVDKLEKIDYDMFGDERGNIGIFNKYSHYRGKVELKKEGLQHYKYTIAGENCYENDYFSEKIIDGILNECVVFYHGCTNISKYINPKCYIEVDFLDPEKSMYIIKKSIRENEWEKRIDAIKQEKKKILTELNILNLVNNAVTGQKNYFE